MKIRYNLNLCNAWSNKPSIITIEFEKDDNTSYEWFKNVLNIDIEKEINNYTY